MPFPPNPPILQPGAVDDDGNWLDLDVMARYMDDALPAPDDPEDSGKAGRRQFFIAIATGVIDYLRLHHADGFAINNNTTPTDVRLL